MMIALSLAGLLGIQGLYDGMVTHMINTTIRSDSGEISLYAKEYRLHKSLAYTLSPFSLIEEKLSKVEGISAYAMRLQQEGLIATAHRSLGASIKGISLENERDFGQFDSFIIKGSYSFGKGGKEVLIGATLAKKLHLDIGSRVVFTAQDAKGEINALSFRISGMIKTGNPALDEYAVFVSMKKMSDFLNLKDTATQVTLRVADVENIGKVQEALKSLFPKADVLRWDELYPQLLQMQDIVQIFNFASYMIVFIVAALGIFGVILVSVLERMREFSIMLAIGTPFKMVRAQILLEASFLGLIGFLTGAFLGWLILIYLSTWGVDLRSFEAGLETFGLNAVLIADIKLYYFFQAFFAVFLATLLSVIWPLHILKKVKPIEIIQGKML
jgi:ABC-type lipoprotein release transport system permease subunit